MQLLDHAGEYVVPTDSPNHYVEHLRVAALSVGTYCIPAGGDDDQRPHTEDEVYVVLRGRGTFVADDARVPVQPGTTLHVPPGEDHRFVDVTEDLVLLVVFAPPYGSDTT
ncbi:cupin domain-containing protein [soil metagenome]|jgi:mannose-6-phosphate isomerase-like protein (cupin superfamily)|nr:cupin domain-containing protein [Acidothermales bacterium]MDQ3432777.1 cupin domain-containing protein [Actinomycetota bacterium]